MLAPPFTATFTHNPLDYEPLTPPSPPYDAEGAAELAWEERHGSPVPTPYDHDSASPPTPGVQRTVGSEGAS